MTRPSRSASSSSQQVEVLHFPFMAVLSCIIGALAFILFIFIAHSKDLVDSSEIEKDILGAQDSLKDKEAEFKRLTELLEEQRESLADKQMPPPEELESQKDKLAQLKSEVPDLASENKRLETVFAKLDRANREQAIELETLRKKASMLKASRSVIATINKDTKSGPSGPLFVECGASGATIWPNGVVAGVSQEGPEQASFAEWLSNAGAEVSDKYVVFLVRPEGIATFDRLRKLSEAEGWQVGYEPVLPEWEIFFG